MRIGVVTSSYPRRDGDPAGSFVHGLARALARRGHRIEVVCPEPAGPTDWATGTTWLDGIRVFPAPYARPRRLQRLFFEAGTPDNLRQEPWLATLAPLAIAVLARQVWRRQARWDAVVSHWLVPSALAACAPGLLPGETPRHLAIAHSGDVHLLGRLPGGRTLLGFLARRVDALGAVTSQLQQELSSLLAGADAGTPVTTPMGIDLGSLRSARPRGEIRRELGLGDDLAVLSLGRLVPIKGVDVLIDALAGIPGIALVVAGDGPERDRLESTAASRGIPTRFLGTVDPRRRAELLAAADAFALPSRVLSGGRHEGLPLALLEAMAVGLPMVATRTGGVPEVVEDGVSGLLIPPDDPGALRDALGRLAGSPALRASLGDAARPVGAARDWDALAPLYERLLRPATAAP
ncbi:MAG TPA: glycosyltransferase family 4 protein [Polyangia bacterium]|nr:glycosyltransferase family 4 protein [Polyangia bacterium]